MEARKTQPDPLEGRRRAASVGWFSAAGPGEWLAGSLTLAMLAACSKDSGLGSSGPQAVPNLLMVAFDTTRADHLSCYGYERTTTPAVDALAGRGLLLEQAYSASSLTSVSASTFMTGVLPPRHGVRSLFLVGQESIAPQIPTLAELLQEAGFATGGFVSAPPIGARCGLGRGFDVFDELSDHRASEPGTVNPYQRRADVTCNLALEWLAERNGSEAPFFLWVHFFDAHDPTLVPPHEFLAREVNFEWPSAASGEATQPAARPRLTPAQRIDLYDAEIRFQDLQFERLIEALRTSGQLENTLVCFLSDHGEGLGQHGFWTHGLLYDEQLRVPWVLAGPGVPSGTRLSSRVRLVDLVPTLAELLPIDLGGQALDGASVLPLLQGAEPHERDVYAEVRHQAEDSLGRDPEMTSLTSGPWKLIRRPFGDDELYQLGQDRGERRNVVSKHSAVLGSLRQGLAAIGRGLESGGGESAIDAETRAMLKELGYL